MAKTTVYSFAKRLMDDENFNCGGIIENEKRYLDSIGFEYTETTDGCWEDGEDLHEFYKAMITIWRLQKKYSR